MADTHISPIRIGTLTMMPSAFVGFRMAHCSDGDNMINLFFDGRPQGIKISAEQPKSNSDQNYTSVGFIVPNQIRSKPKDEIYYNSIFAQLETAISTVGNLDSYYIFSGGLIIRKNLVRSDFVITTQSTHFEITIGDGKFLHYVYKSYMKSFIRSVKNIFEAHSEMVVIPDNDHAHSIFVASKRQISNMLMAVAEIDEDNNTMIDINGELTHVYRTDHGQEFVDILFEHIKKLNEKEEIGKLNEKEEIVEDPKTSPSVEVLKTSNNPTPRVDLSRFSPQIEHLKEICLGLDDPKCKNEFIIALKTPNDRTQQVRLRLFLRQAMSLMAMQQTPLAQKHVATIEKQLTDILKGAEDCIEIMFDKSMELTKSSIVSAMSM